MNLFIKLKHAHLLNKQGKQTYASGLGGTDGLSANLMSEWGVQFLPYIPSSL